MQAVNYCRCNDIFQDSKNKRLAEMCCIIFHNGDAFWFWSNKMPLCLAHIQKKTKKHLNIIVVYFTWIAPKWTWDSLDPHLLLFRGDPAESLGLFSINLAFFNEATDWWKGKRMDGVNQLTRWHHPGRLRSMGSDAASRSMLRPSWYHWPGTRVWPSLKW